tara:strand:+ start:153 stop:848 length:696 start_codon:yes stop_codon:yes gene_type:complete
MIKVIKHLTIQPHIVPWIHNIGFKNSEEAKEYIKKTSYSHWNHFLIILTSEDINNDDYKNNIENNEIFTESKIDTNLSEIVGEIMYKPYKFFSEFYQIEINENMGLIGKIDGINQNKDTIVLRNTYYTSKKWYHDTYEALEIQMLTLMAIWNAKKGIIYITNMDKRLEFTFDKDKWDTIFLRIKEWADTININDYRPLGIEEFQKKGFKLNFEKIEKFCNSPYKILNKNIV